MGKRMPTHGKRDSNEGEIVRALRAIGAQVYRLNMPGLPDALVNWLGHTYFMEFKQEKGKLTAAQVALHEVWEGDPILVVRSADEALAALDARITA